MNVNPFLSFDFPKLIKCNKKTENMKKGIDKSAKKWYHITIL